MVSHTAIVFTRHTILEWIRRNQNDQNYGELFFMFCEDIQDMDLTNALKSLMALFVEHISTLSANITSYINSKVTNWMRFSSFIYTGFICKCLLEKLSYSYFPSVSLFGKNIRKYFHS